MRRILALFSVLIMLGVCTISVWAATHPTVAPFLVSGATDIQIVGIGLGEQQISYHATGQPYSWYWDVARTLEAQQWHAQNERRPDLAGPNYNPLIPLTFTRSTFGVLVEEAVLDPDSQNPNIAHLRITRRIAIAW
jgi:hypothetical protein